MNFTLFTLKCLSFCQRVLFSLKVIIWGGKGKILVYHEVDFDNSNNVEPSSFCSVQRFSEIINKYKGRFCSIDEFLKIGSEKGVVVSFDDVPESMFINAYPLLKKYRIPFIIYVCPKFVDKNGFLSKKQLLELAKDPLCTIGAHTMNHKKLRYESDSYSDIRDSKLYLEKLTGKNIDHLAYPFGRVTSVSKRVIKEAREAGFKSAVSTIPTLVPVKYNPWFMPRLVEN